jgi:exosortase
MVKPESRTIRQSASSWRPVSVLALLAILAALYWDVVRVQIEDCWDDPNYSHAFLVPFFSGYLIWRRRKDLAGSTGRGHWIGLLLLVAGLGARFLGDVAGETFLMRTSLIVVIVGLILFHLGRAVLRVVAFPVLFLFFTVPLPVIVFNAVAFPLQNLAAGNAAWTLDALGVPVWLDGNVIHLSRITLGVSEACSGIRSLISLLAVAVAWAHLSLSGLLAAAALVASALPITVFANAFRVVATGLIAQWFGVEYAEGTFHTFSGWVIFLAAFLGLAAVHGLLHQVQRRRPHAAS